CLRSFVHRQDLFAAGRCPAAKRDGNVVALDKLASFLGERRPVGGTVLDDWFDLTAEHATSGVDLLNCHQVRILHRHLAYGHGARERVKNADLDGVVADGSGPRARGGCGARRIIVVVTATSREQASHGWRYGEGSPSLEDPTPGEP